MRRPYAAYQHRIGHALHVGDEIQHVVHPVAQIHVRPAALGIHHLVALRATPAESVRTSVGEAFVRLRFGDITSGNLSVNLREDIFPQQITRQENHIRIQKIVEIHFYNKNKGRWNKRRICLCDSEVVVLFGHVADQFQHLVGITPLVVVPRDELHKVVVEHDAGVGVEDGGVRVAHKVGAHHALFGVAEHALQLVFGSALHGSLDFIVSGRTLQAAGEVHDGNVQRGHAERHAGETALQRGDDLGDGLGSAGGGGDDVAVGSTTSTPVFHRWTIHYLLGGGGGVYGGHQTFYHAEVFVNDLDERSQTVGGAGGVGNDVLAHVLGVVHTHYKHRSVVLGRSGHHHALGTRLDVFLRILTREEQTGGFYDVFSTDLVPLQIDGVFFCGHADGAAVDHEVAVFYADGPVETSVYGVVQQQVGHVVHLQQVVDSYNFKVFMFDGSTHHETTDTAEPVDTDFYFFHTKIILNECLTY